MLIGYDHGEDQETFRAVVLSFHTRGCAGGLGGAKMEIIY